MAVALTVLWVTCRKALSLLTVSKQAQHAFQYGAPTGGKSYWKQQLFAVDLLRDGLPLGDTAAYR